MITKTQDHIYLAAGGVALLGTCIWAFMQQSAISSFQEPVNAPVSGGSYEPQPLSLSAPESKTWASPKAQSSGSEWLFDVFTPPKIYYNVDSGKFTVTVPINDPVVVGPVEPPPPPTFGLQLVKVEQPLFRLQLIGYVGEGPGARGNFLKVTTGDLVFATSGKKFPDLNLEVVRFSAERVRTQVEGGTEIIETVAKAVVRDTITGEEIPLDVKVRRHEGPLKAVFRTDDGREVSGSVGEQISVGDTSFSVGDITETPPSAVVTKSGPAQATPETQTLTIPPPPPPPSATSPTATDGTEEPPFSPANPEQPIPAGFPGF